MSYLLLSGYPGVGKCKILKELANDFSNVIWITTINTIGNVRKGLKKDAWIVDAFSWGMDEPKDERDFIILNPTNLNEISLSFSKLLEKIKGEYLLIMNSISGLTVYHPLPKILNLVRTLIIKVEKDGAKAVFTLVRGAQESAFEISLMMIFPTIVEIEGDKMRVIKSIHEEYEKGVYSLERAKEILTDLIS